jgi:hypothetical protein
MKIKIEQRHIDQSKKILNRFAIQKNYQPLCQNCPIALATSEILQKPVSVTGVLIVIGEDKTVNLPENAKSFIRLFGWDGYLSKVSGPSKPSDLEAVDLQPFEMEIDI